MAGMDSYARHAEVWAYFAGDRTEEAAFWEALAGRYGRRALALMAATGEMAAILARRGFTITAVDLIPEMVAEGRRRYADLPGLRFTIGNVTALQLEPPAYDFAFASDFNHLLTPESFRAALHSVGRHLHPGGGLALELWQPTAESWATERRRFDTFVSPTDTGLHPTFTRTWKEGRTIYDAPTRRVTIEQEVFIQRGAQVEQFSHNFSLQIYTREEITAFLQDTGFRITKEYGSYDRSPWTAESGKWIVEAEKY